MRSPGLSSEPIAFTVLFLAEAVAFPEGAEAAVPASLRAPPAPAAAPAGGAEAAREVAGAGVELGLAALAATLT